MTRMWIAVALDINTSEELIFCDLVCFKLEGNPTVRPLAELPRFLEYEVKEIIGHNVVGFDLMAIEKLFLYRWTRLDDVFDTMLMSQAQNYHRFGPEAGHSMAVWGRALGMPKQEHEDWLNFSPEMAERCRSDVRINAKMWTILLQEFKRLRQRNPLIRNSMRAEHYASWWAGQSELHGWPFDSAAAERLLVVLTEAMSLAEKLIEPLIQPMTVIIDPEPRVPKYKQNGDYHMWVCNHFPGLLPEDAEDENAPLQVVGPYQRFEYKPVELGNIIQVKKFLHKIGWEPDEWNYKRDPETGKLEKHSAKLSDSSLELLGEIGQKLITYYTLRSRLSITEGWLKKVRHGRVHGGCMTIATPTHRARHSTIVNVPSGGALYGGEMRELFKADPGMLIIGADSAGNQLRGLCHDLNNPEYTATVVHGDVHTANTEILREMHPPAVRGNGKKFIYAYLFGAGGGKLAFDLTGVRNAQFGNKLKELFATRVKGLKELVSRLEREYDDSLFKYGSGRISAIDGRPIFADVKRKALNYRLQSTEGITCKCAIMFFVREMLARYPNVRWQPLIFMHDEIQIMVEAKFVDEIAALAKLAFKEGPTLAGVEIMDGDAKIGLNWHETH